MFAYGLELWQRRYVHITKLRQHYKFVIVVRLSSCGVLLTVDCDFFS